ncbi:MAG: DUF1849 family protein [Pseudomonadota bacterium]
MANGSARSIWRVGLVVGVFGLAHAAAADPLQPHRAVYDLTLSSAEPSTSLISASGRLVFEIGGSECDGYSVNFRNVTRVTDREGAQRVTDLRSQTFETLAPAVLSFAHQTHIDDTVAREIEGTARGRVDGIAIDISTPKSTEMKLGRAIFPTAHTRLILEAADAGERIIEATVFDGGDEANTLYETATVIGPGQTGLPGASADEMAVLSTVPDAANRTAWRLVISYFDAAAEEGERVPDYEITFTMLDNGVSYNVSFNYGSFTLSGELTELMLTDAADCSDN